MMTLRQNSRTLLLCTKNGLIIKFNVTTLNKELLLRKPLVLHCLGQPCSMLTMAIPDVEIFAVRFFTVFLMCSPIAMQMA